MPEYRNPIPTVDAAIFIGRGIVLVKRKNPPLGWALPGGFVNEGESFLSAVKREVQEETGLEPDFIRQLQTYSDPARDPRGHFVTTVYIAFGGGIPKGADDAAEARVFAWDEIPWDQLAFDHKKIVEDAYRLWEDGIPPQEI